MKAVDGHPNLIAGVWREKNGWCAKIERLGAKPGMWYASGFETEEAAAALLEEHLKVEKQ